MFKKIAEKIEDAFTTVIAIIFANLFVWCITSEVKKIQKVVKLIKEKYK